MKSQKLITKSDTKKKSPALERKSAQKKSDDLLTHDYNPLENISCRIGDSACAAKHVSVIQRAGLFHPMNEGQKVQSLLRLQQQYGNRFVQRVIAQYAIQTKLKIGQLGDKYEQEADRMAEAVIRMPEPQVPQQAEEEDELLQAQPFSKQITPLVQRQVEEEEKRILQAKEIPGQPTEVAPELESRIHFLTGGGQVLAETTRAFFEPRFGCDFSQVRVHTDAESDTLNCLLNARAFTTAHDIFFAQGTYNPNSESSQKLLAHELSHVVQQQGKLLGIQRRVTSDYNVIKDDLSYGIFDWSITDEEAREVLQILDSLSQDELLGTVQQMRRDEILSRLFGNVSDSDRRRFADLLDRIQEIEKEISGLPGCCKEELKTIDRIISSGRALRPLLGTAPFITLVGEHPAHAAVQHLTANWDIYVEAVRSVSSIVKNRVYTVVALHLLDHRNTTEEEFWKRMEALWR